MLQPISAVGKNFPFESYFFYSSLTFLVLLIFYLALINLPSSLCNDCHETAYLNYLIYIKQLFSYLGSC